MDLENVRGGRLTTTGRTGEGVAAMASASISRDFAKLTGVAPLFKAGDAWALGALEESIVESSGCARGGGVGWGDGEGVAPLSNSLSLKIFFLAQHAHAFGSPEMTISTWESIDSPTRSSTCLLDLTEAED